MAPRSCMRRCCPERWPTCRDRRTRLPRWPGDLPGSLELRSDTSDPSGPPKHAQGAQAVPAARLAGVPFQLEVDGTRMRVLERPASRRVPLGLDDVEGFGDAFVGSDGGAAQVIEAPQDVVVPPRRKRDPGPFRFD